MPMITCLDCSKEMSDAATACPNCGRPNAVVEPSAQVRPVGVLLGIGIFLVPLLFSWFTLRKGHTTTARVISLLWLVIYAAFAASLDSGAKSNDPAANFPECDSREAQTGVASVLENAPLGRVYGLSLINIKEAKQVAASAASRDCTGTASLSNGQSYPMTYRFYRDGDNIMIKAEVLGL